MISDCAWARATSARRGEPGLRRSRIRQRADAVRVGISGANKGRFGCCLQRNGSVVFLQSRFDFVVGQRHLAKSLIGSLLQLVRCLFTLRLRKL